MPLSDQQWNEFFESMTRITLTQASKQRVVDAVAGTESDSDPWASFSAIEGKQEFIERISTHLRRVSDPGKIILFFTAILSYTHNTVDKESIRSLIEQMQFRRGSSPNPQPKQTQTRPPIANSIAMSKTQNNLVSDYIDFDIELTSEDLSKKIFAKIDCRDHDRNKILEMSYPCDVSGLANQTAFNAIDAKHQHLVSYGHQIYSNLFTGNLAMKFGQAIEKKTNLIRIGISSTGTDCSHHVWELICSQGNAEKFFSLRKEYSVARLVKSDKPSDIRSLPQRIRILFGHASPIQQDAIDKAYIASFIEIVTRNGHEEPKFWEKLNIEAIEKATSREGESYDVIHFICHGKTTRDDDGVLIFEDDLGNAQKIRASLLAEKLRGFSPSLVILQACQSGDASSTKEFITGFAEILVNSGIPAVLAFRGKPGIGFSSKFLLKFYEHWLTGNDSLEVALYEARLSIQNAQTNSTRSLPIDAWSHAVLYRQPGVFLKIENKSGPVPDPNDVLALYIIIILNSQPKILKSIKDFLIREKMIDATNSAQSATDVDLIANRLITPRPNSSESTRCAIFLQMLTDSNHRGYRFSDEGEKNALRGIRDCVFLASLPDMHTRGMKNAIKNAIQMNRPEGSSSADVPVLDMDIAMKIGRYAHALVIDEMAKKTGDQSFVFQLLNKQFDSDDTSIFFEDRYYSYEVIKEPNEYRNKTKPKERKESFAKGCRLEGYDPKFPNSYTETLNSHLETRFRARHLVFVLAEKPADDDEKEILQEVMDEFRRMVFIQASPDGNATIYEAIMMQIAEIDNLLHKLFSN